MPLVTIDGGHRDSTAILVAYRHRLRASELVSLRWDDIDFAAGKLHVRRAKGGTSSVHPIGGRELRALRRLKRETSASTLCVCVRASGPFERGGLSAHGCARRQSSGLRLPHPQPHASS
jgi:type 1 fimbriae regulatory protein FimB/type 1 fimbriae regulatory protein FimE